MGKIIEFIGSPGSGKSELSNIAVNYLSKSGFKVLDRLTSQFFGFKKWLSSVKRVKYQTQKDILEFFLNIMPQKIGRRVVDSTLFIDIYDYKKYLINNFTIKNPILIDFTKNRLEEVFNSNKRNYRKTRFLAGFKENYAQYQNAEELMENEIVVLDEAALNKLLMIHSPINVDEIPPDYQKYINQFIDYLSPIIDYNFFVYTDPKLCIERQKSRRSVMRGWKKIMGIDDINDKNILKELERRVKDYQIIHETLLENGVKSFKIDNNGSLEDAKEQLYPCLDEIIEDLEEADD